MFRKPLRNQSDELIVGWQRNVILDYQVWPGKPTGEKLAMRSARTHVQSTLAQGLGFVLGMFGLVHDRFDGQKKDRGATAVEYGLLVGLIAIVIIVGVSALGGTLQRIFARIAASLGGP